MACKLCEVSSGNGILGLFTIAFPVAPYPPYFDFSSALIHENAIDV